LIEPAKIKTPRVQLFNLCLVDEIKNLGTNKAFKKF
jgi:hypothetical protein